MARKKLIASAGLSMMDLISNALAGVLILFFILAKSKFPSFPPERVCGTLVMEFSFQKSDTGDYSSVYVNYTLDKENEKSVPCLSDKDGKVRFDTSIINLSTCIEGNLPASNCSYDTTKLADTINPIPAVRTYQVFNDKNNITKHIVILHEPPAGRWEIGLLYYNHAGLLESMKEDSVKIQVTWYGVKHPNYPRDTTFQLLAPTSRCFSVMRFEKENEIMPDSTFFVQSNPN